MSEVQLVVHTLLTSGSPLRQSRAERRCWCEGRIPASIMGWQQEFNLQIQGCAWRYVVFGLLMFFLFISDVNPTIYPQIYPSCHGPLIFPKIVIRDMCSLVCCVFFFIVPLKDARLTVIGFQILSLSTEPFLPFGFCTSIICTYLTSTKPVSMHGS